MNDSHQAIFAPIKPPFQNQVFTSYTPIIFRKMVGFPDKSHEITIFPIESP